MGLLSETLKGMQTLKNFGWERANSNLPICLPKDISTLFKVKNVKFHGGILAYKDIFEKYWNANAEI